MPEDSIQQELLSDLRVLRRLEGEPNEFKMAGRHALVEQLGSGNIATAYKRLMSWADEAGSVSGTDIHAYFFTIGLGVGGYNLEDRLRRYAETFHVVHKTALRRSDRGLIALSHLIRDRSVEWRPSVYVWLTQSGPTVGLTATFFTVVGTEFRQPRVYMNGKHQELSKLKWVDDEPGTNMLKARHRILINLTDELPASGQLITFHIWWVTEMHPTFELGTTLADSRLFPVMRVTHDNRASFEVEWQNVNDRCEVAELAISKYKFVD